jgi:hypothetical protein
MPGAGKSLNWWIIISSLCLFISAPHQEETEVRGKELEKVIKCIWGWLNKNS